MRRIDTDLEIDDWAEMERWERAMVRKYRADGVEDVAHLYQLARAADLVRTFCRTQAHSGARDEAPTYPEPCYQNVLADFAARPPAVVRAWRAASAEEIESDKPATINRSLRDYIRISRQYMRAVSQGD